jgi:CubicO group peptidase (beta-lactamase class C family)
MRRQGHFGRVLLFLALFCVHPAVFAQAQPPKPAEPKTVEDLQKAIQAILTRTHVPGAGVALVDREHIIWAGGIGKADVAANKPVTADTVFRVGSISKGFVALALLKLQEQGKIDIAARVRDLAPEIPIVDAWEATHPVRVVNLLEHTAGFDDMHFTSSYNLTDPPDILLRDVFFRFPESQVVRWPPGTRPSYSNPGYGLAGYLIEKVTGRRFEDYIQDEILTPLGMKTSSFRLTDVRGRLSQGYVGNPPQPVPYENIYFRPAGNLMASPAEMALFVQMMLNRGKVGGAELVRPESISRMETPQTTNAARAGLKAGYGLAVFSDFEHPVKAYGHDGGMDGFISDYEYIPEAGRGYVVLLNSTSFGAGTAMEDITTLIFNFLTADLPNPKPPVGKITEAALRDFPGYYQPANPRNQAFAFLHRLLDGKTVYAKEGKLYMKGLLELSGTELIPVAGDQFRTAKEADASWIFCRDEAGNPLFSDGDFYGERTGAAWPKTRLMLIVLAILAMGTSPVFALIWVALKIVWRIRGVRPRAAWPVPLLATPLLAVLSGVAALAFVSMIRGWEDATMNYKTAGVCAATWAFAGFSVAGLLLSLGSLRLEINRFARIHSLLVSVACCGMTWYLAAWHMIGFRFWTY